MRIDVVSDTVCPWCYVGKRQLDLALAQRPDLTADITWRPFQLAPEIPASGVDRKTYWRQKFGDGGRIGAMTARLREVGSSLDIEFDFDAIERQPNTLASHKLLHWRAGQADQHALKEAILKAFFVAGEDIGDPDVLVRLAEDTGLSGAEAFAALESDEIEQEVVAQIDEARRLGISGVPTFIFDQRTAVSGAQPANVLVDAMERAAA